MAKKHDPKTGRFVRTTPDYKALYEAECAAHDRVKEAFLDERAKSEHYLAAYRKLQGEYDKRGECIEFLLDHCPFWVRWMYRKHFDK